MGLFDMERISGASHFRQNAYRPARRRYPRQNGRQIILLNHNRYIGG
jgi:hypothetical protein